MVRARLAVRRRFPSVLFLFAVALAPASGVVASMRFAAVGDIGSTLATATDPEGPLVTAVTSSIKAGNPDFIITTGDNCHDAGSTAPTGYYDLDVGQYFHAYIGGYTGTYGAGSPVNRFFPAIGNHDTADGLSKYQAFFPALANKRYYDFTAGAAHFFILNGDESGGSSPTSAQGLWLQSALAASTSPWNFVVVHYPPYTSSNRHDPSTEWRWPYKAWGADAVFSGHIHAYERLVENGLTYFTTGVAGETIASGHSSPIDPGSQYFYNGDHGAMQVDFDGTQATFRYVTRTGLVVDPTTQAVQANAFTATGGSYNVAGNWLRGRSVSAPDAVAGFLQAVSAPVTVDAAVTLGTLNLHSPGGSTLSGPAAVRLETTGGATATLSAQGGDHYMAAPVTVAADTILEVLDNTLTLAASLDDSAAHKLTRTGNGKLILAGSQHYGAGTLFEAADGWTVFQSDAGQDGSVLSVHVLGGATVDFAVGQSLDVLTIDAGGVVRLTGGHGQVLSLNALDMAPGATLMYSPEPATLAIVAVGLAALWRRRESSR